MIDVNALRGLMAQKQISQSKMAGLIGIAPKTFYCKMRRKVFSSAEIAIMIKELDIDEPMRIFFADDVA